MTKRWQAVESRTAGRVFPDPVALWSCVVTFRNLAMPVVVALNDSEQIVWAAAGKFKEFKLKQFTPEQFKPK